MTSLYYNAEEVLAMIHARLDDETRKLLAHLRHTTGWNLSEIIRRGIHALARQEAPTKRTIFLGLGEFDSGIPDLGSAKEHLDGFGRK